ncbi:MAG: long-chain fatty acid--CoA ligase [Ignavibacteriales bacterium]|nr:long-chain fatty acid--CoA ligase [Ignavibacteriales bacterium]
MGPRRNFKTIPELFRILVDEYGKNNPKPMLSHKVDNTYVNISYQQFKEDVELAAHGLLSLEIKEGDKVILIAENRPEWMMLDFAILGIGAINVPLYTSLTPADIKFIVNNSGAKMVIVSNKVLLSKFLRVREECPEVENIVVINDKDFDSSVPELHSLTSLMERGEDHYKFNPGLFTELNEKVKPYDICTIIYTSGTTGEPKGVLLTHENIVSNVLSSLECLEVTHNDVFLSFLPLCHIFERMAGFYLALATGSHVAFAVSIETVPQNMVEVKPTLMTAVPRLFERFHAKVIKTVESGPEKKQKIFRWGVDIGKKYAAAKKSGKVPIGLKAKFKVADTLVLKKIRERTGGRLRFFVSGGAALPKHLGEFFEALGILILEGYGLTESSPVIAVNRLEAYKFGSVGKIIPGVQVKIAKEHPDDQDGEILAKGPNIMQGYYKLPEETALTVKDGWLYTGDIGFIDSDGFLMITDRKKNLFKTSGGKYVAPTPIENLFLMNKYIEQFVLIGYKKTFLSALIVPDFENLKEYAQAEKVDFVDMADLVKKKEVIKLFEQEIVKTQKTLANYEKVRKFALMEKPFTIEDGEMTPSLKIKRKVVEKKYAGEIERMYA